jgi:arylsulfatase
MSDRPNILFILSDQHNAKCMGTAGHPLVQTPNLDRLAAEGVRFTSAITQSPICTPSRVSFFSGQYPHNHGHYGTTPDSGMAPCTLPTLPGHLREHGYRAAVVGKVHCPYGWIEPECDDYLGACADTEFPPGTELSDYDRYLEARGLLALRDDDTLPEQHPVRSWRSKDGRASNLEYRDSVEGWCVSETRKLIELYDEQPWFIQVGLPRPHQIYTPAQQFWDLYPEDMPMPPSADADMTLKPPHMRTTRKEHEESICVSECFFGPKGDYEAFRRRKLRGYYGMITQTDYAVGELLDFLREAGLEENTIVIYTSDHGEYACEFGLLEKAPGICSDAVTRVPHIWRWPGHIEAGCVSDRIVESCIDLSATVCALTGVPVFATGDGRDISPLLEGQDIEIHQVGVTENAWSKSIRKGNWRYVHYVPEMFAEEQPDGPVGELYDLDDDPWEMTNLFYDPGHREKVAEMREALLNWLVTTTRVITTCPAVMSEDVENTHRRDGDGKIAAAHLRRICRDHNTYL